MPERRLCRYLSWPFHPPLGRKSISINLMQFLCHHGFTGFQSGVDSAIAFIWCVTVRFGINFGAQVAKARAKAVQNKLKYQSVLEDKHEIPAWIDDFFSKVVHPNPAQFLNSVSLNLAENRHSSRYATGTLLSLATVRYPATNLAKLISSNKPQRTHRTTPSKIENGSLSPRFLTNHKTTMQIFHQPWQLLNY